MKILVAYYSRTGTTKKAAEELAKRLGADLEELIDTKSRSGVFGYIRSGRDAMQGKSTLIEKVKYSPTDYDLVIIGSPVWAGAFCPAVRTYIDAVKNNIKNIAFLITQGAIPPKQDIVFSKLEDLSGKKSKANLHLSTKQVGASDYEKELKEFINKIGV